LATVRIALVTETFPPEINGVAMTLETLVRGMAERGHYVEVVRPFQPAWDSAHQKPDDLNGRVEMTTVRGLPLPRYEGLRFGLPAKRRLLRSWRDPQRKPDVVHIATEGPLGFSATAAARKLGIPLTSTFHTNFHQYGKHYGYGVIGGLVERYLRFVHDRCTCTLVPSRGQKSDLADAGFTNLFTLARGVDTERFHPDRRDHELRKSWGAAGDEPVCVYVGRVAQEKNIPLAVRAFEAFCEREPRAKFVMVGDGPARAGIEKQHPEFVYAGMRRGEDLATHYASADVFLFGSTTETFGNVVTEAMASGLAVLTYDYAAGQMLIESGANGLLAAFDEEEAFIGKARELAEMEPAARAAMGRAARSTAEGMSWSAILDKFEAVLRDAAQHGRMTVDHDA
jgi:glycosyltransferase involved in cell wall biosynthesis